MWAICGSVGFPAFCANAPLVERHTAAIAAIRRTDMKPSFGPADCVRRAFTEVDIRLDESGCQKVPNLFVTFNVVRGMSALPPKADIGTQSRNVRFVPKGDIAGRFTLCEPKSSDIKLMG